VCRESQWVLRFRSGGSSGLGVMIYHYLLRERKLKTAGTRSPGPQFKGSAVGTDKLAIARITRRSRRRPVKLCGKASRNSISQRKRHTSARKVVAASSGLTDSRGCNLRQSSRNVHPHGKEMVATLQPPKKAAIERLRLGRNDRSQSECRISPFECWYFPCPKSVPLFSSPRYV
jgi:hypothetical protein